MPLLVTIIKTSSLANAVESSKTFEEQGGSLGRGKDNTWVLDDPERFLSACHCQISSENGQFYITDLSTNGTFFNGSVHPMGKGTKQALNDGNVFTLGDYEFSVSTNRATQGVGADPFSSSPSSSSPSNNDFGVSDSNPFDAGHVSSSDPLFTGSAEETDPLAALDKAQGGSAGGGPGFAGESHASNNPFQSSPSSDPFGGASHSDQANPLNEQISWPSSAPEQRGGGAIPDDWDDDFLSASAPVAQPQQSPPPIKPSTPLTEPPVMPAPPSASATPVTPAKPQNADAGNAQALRDQLLENKKLQIEVKILKQQVSAQKNKVQADVSVDMRLIKAMGLHNSHLVDEEINQINQLVGEVVREMVSGLMQVLGSRSSIKNEFRMNVTTIQPVENNPLKFSANVDDALENMFIKEGNAYKKPVEAVKECFDGIAEHQVAILAGIRAAFEGVLERFDPILLEQRFVKQKKGGIMPGSQKAKNWECYLEYYDEFTGDIDRSFQYLFGDEFVKAYEDQLQKLAIAKKINNDKSS